MIEALYGDARSPFHILVSAEITGPLDVARLRAVIAQTTARHSSLRTVFARGGNGLLERLVLPSWQPLFIEQSLPPLVADADPVEVVHAMIGAATAQLLRPYDRPPVAFLLSHVRPGRAVLSVLAHHAVADGWSFGLLWQEIALRYADPGAGSVLGPAPDMDVIVALEQTARTQEACARRAAILAGWPAVAQLPSDLERPRVRSLAGRRLTFGLSSAARAGCVQLAAHLGVSRNVVLLAGWALVIARMTGQTRLIVGVPVLSRTTSAARQVVGSGANLGPVTCEIPLDGSVATYLRQTAAAVRDAIACGTVPFEDLTARLSLPADRARNPLVQFALACEDDVIPGGLHAGDVELDLRVGGGGGSTYDATLFVLRWQPAPVLAVEYATSVLTSSEAAGLANGLNTALEQLAAEPESPLAEVTTIPAADRAWLLSAGTGPDVEGCPGLWQLIEEVARRQPDAIAIRDRDPQRTLTYRELIRAAIAQSAALAAAGVSERDCVALALGRGVDEVVAVLAILRLGACYTSLGPDRPTPAAVARLDTANVTVLLGQPEALSALGEATAGRLMLAVGSSQAAPNQAAPDQTAPPPAPYDRDRVAYIGFTESTGGSPVGAMVACRAVARLAHAPSFLLPGAADRFMRLAELGTDSSMLEIFTPLLAGGTIEVYPSEDMTPDAVASFLQDRQVTGLWLSAGLFRMVADHRPDGFQPVVQLLTSGDVVTSAQVADVLRACPGIRVTVGYGPAGNGTLTAAHHLDHAAENGGALPLGQPIQGTSLIVLDRQGLLAPRGAEGELFVGGDGLVQGYVGLDPETVAARGPVRLDGRDFYGTGDLVRWDQGGNLRLVGRRDHPDRHRGFRSDFEAVEDAIRAYPGVRDVAVVRVHTAIGDQHLLAGVVADPAPGLRAALRAYAAARLPAHARPARWAWVEQFPMTANRELDVGELAEIASEDAPEAPVASRHDAIPAWSAGLGDTETVIAQVWRDLLCHSDFTDQDWFFDVGGDSLLLIRAHTVITEKLRPRELSVADLYAYPTIAELGAKLRADAARQSS